MAGCALLRKKFKEDLCASCVENRILQDSSGSSNENFNVANALREPFVVNLDPEYGDEIKIAELKENFNSMSIEINKKEKLLQLEQLANLSTYLSKRFNFICYDDDDDDDEDYAIAVTPSLSTEELDNSLKTHFIERLLYDNSSPRPPEEFVSANSDTEIESFSPSPILVEDNDSLMEEIDLSFTPDYPMPPSIEDDDYTSERDILILKDLLSNDALSLSEIESFHFDIPSFSRPPAKPPDGNTRILNEKSPDLLSHRGLKAFQPFAKCPMMIHGKNTPILDVPFFYFYPP
nr:hypothetical protein [Tanacetum cinerariifolium]